MGACAASRIQFGDASIRRVRGDRGAVLPRGLRPDDDGVAVAWTPRALDRDRRGVGNTGLLAAVARRSGAGAFDRGGQLGDSSGPDARDARDRRPDHVLAGAGRRSSRTRRRAAGIPRRGRGVFNVVRPSRLTPAKRGGFRSVSEWCLASCWIRYQSRYRPLWPDTYASGANGWMPSSARRRWQRGPRGYTQKRMNHYMLGRV